MYFTLDFFLLIFLHRFVTEVRVLIFSSTYFSKNFGAIPEYAQAYRFNRHVFLFCFVFGQGAMRCALSCGSKKRKKTQIIILLIW